MNPLTPSLNPSPADLRGAELSDEECTRLILEEGPLTPREVAELSDAVRRDYFETLARRLRRVGLTAFRRQVGRAPASPGPIPPRRPPVGDWPLSLFIDHFARRVFPGKSGV